MKAKDEFFPEEIRNLPEADIPNPGWKAYVSQGPDHQVLYFDCEPTGEIKPHSHGAQFGVVLDGEMELTIDGKPLVVRKGDSYYIPPGVIHSAKMLTKLRAIDFFADRNRWTVKKKK